MAGTDPNRLVAVASDWYLANRRELPWRAEDRTPWGVLVSEVMLQQTQVTRVLPAWIAWMQRWPTPAALAAASPGEAVRQWDRLGYPRRALRLHAAAVAIVERHGGVVPRDEAALRALPGVGEYTAAAVLAFAFGRRALAMDTNVRRVLGRLVDGVAHPGPAVTAAERARAQAMLPGEDAAAALWSIAVMELGALVCTARNPACQRCPVADACAWLAAGRPPSGGPPRRGQRFAGTDRQVRGLLMAVLRESSDPVSHEALRATWAEVVQRERALDGLVADGLVEPLPDGRFRLPVAAPTP
jgi:A/G-specific adenine glycosylase